MSSSGHNLNHFPYFPPSSSSYNVPLSLPQVLNFDPSPNTSVFNIHQPHQDPVSFLAPYLPLSHYSQFAAPESLINFSVSNSCIPDLLAKGAPVATAKKDRHSKIYTAQGLRDRRVRLSIDIARKFFDLQDMLGYDKASKTLEWLFSKSRKAIKELSKTKVGKLSFVSDVENPDEEEDQEEEEGLGGKSKSILRVDEDRDMEEKGSKVELFQVISKESRAKARARVTTIENNIQKGEGISYHYWNHLGVSEASNYPAPANLSIEESSMNIKRKYAKKFMEDAKICDHETEISQWKLLDQIKASKGVLEEPSIIKRKLRPSIISGSSQRNFVISIDSLPINLTQSWDHGNNPNCPFTK